METCSGYRGNRGMYMKRAKLKKKIKAIHKGYRFHYQNKHCRFQFHSCYLQIKMFHSIIHNNTRFQWYLLRVQFCSTNLSLKINRKKNLMSQMEISISIHKKRKNHFTLNQPLQLVAELGIFPAALSIRL